MLRKRKIARDARTGRIVSADYAKANPATTVTETVDLDAKAGKAK